MQAKLPARSTHMQSPVFQTYSLTSMFIYEVVALWVEVFQPCKLISDFVVMMKLCLKM